MLASDSQQEQEGGRSSRPPPSYSCQLTKQILWGDKMKKFKNSKMYQVAKKMPPLYHKLPGKDFDVLKSQVVRWLMNQPEVLDYIWNKLKQSGAVVYDPESGRWKGSNF